MVERTGFPEYKEETHLRLQALGHYWLHKAHSWLREGVMFLLHPSESPEKPWISLALNKYIHQQKAKEKI